MNGELGRRGFGLDAHDLTADELYSINPCTCKNRNDGNKEVGSQIRHTLRSCRQSVMHSLADPTHILPCPTILPYLQTYEKRVRTKESHPA